MKRFKSYIKEETMPYANVKSGVMDINDSDVRDQVNQLLAGVTARKFVTPYIAMERVAKTLANFHIYIPNQGMLEGDSGSVIWPISQYGGKFGQTNDGQIVVAPASQYSVFFEYRMSDCGMFMIFCEVVDKDELDEIISDLEAELNDEGEEEELDEGYVSYRVVKSGAGKSTYDKFGDTKSGTVTIGDKKRAAKDNESDKKEDSKKSSAAEKKARFEEESGYYYGKQPVSELKMSDEQQMDENKKMSDDDKSSVALRRLVAKLKLKDAEKETRPGYVKKQSQAWYDKMTKRANTKIDEENLDEISSELVGKLKKAVDVGGKKLKTKAAEKTLDRRHKAEWLKSQVGVMKEDQLDEISKGTLASYIKKASHDVATKSAQVRGHAMKSKEAVDKQDITTARKEDERSNKAFKKSWKRREGIAKAADKLAKEETQLDEVSDKIKSRYVKKAEKDKAHAERQAAHSEYAAKHSYNPERKDAYKKEAEWLKGIAAKRAKGIERAKK